MYGLWHARALARWACLSASALLACTGQVTGATPVVEDAPIPLDVPEETLEIACTELAADERLLSVTSEGDAWIATGEGFRIQDAFGNETVIEFSASQVRFVSASNEAQALVIADGSVFTLSPEGAEPYYLPEGIGIPQIACGDVRSEGPFFMVTSNGLFQRSGGSFWQWDMPVGDARIDELVSLDGACSAVEANLWLRSGGKIQRLAYGADSRVRDYEHVAGAEAVDVDPRIGLVVQRRGTLFIGQEDETQTRWTKQDFEAGPLEALSVQGGRIWALAAGRLYRGQADGSWVQIVADGLETRMPHRIQAYAAGGAWLESDSALCNVRPQSVLRVRGLRPFERLSTGDLALRVMSPEGAAPRILVDGAEVGTVTPAELGGWAVDGMPVQSPGWHLLDLLVDTQSLTRTIPFAVLPGPDVGWETSLKSIYRARCSGCHDGGGTLVDLSTYDAWVERGDRIGTRVQSGAMPPRPESPLSLEEAAVIEAWIEGGMQP